MVWIDKEIPSPLDNLPIDGLFFVIGDWFAQKVGDAIFEGKKSAEIEFPSGECFGLEATAEGLPLVNVFEDLDIPLYGSLELLLDWASSCQEHLNYTIEITAYGFALLWFDEDDIYEIFYDHHAQQIIDILVED